MTLDKSLAAYLMAGFLWLLIFMYAVEHAAQWFFEITRLGVLTICR
jgi:hypothetical protein